jgi:hypothetical protein
MRVTKGTLVLGSRRENFFFCGFGFPGRGGLWRGLAILRCRSIPEFGGLEELPIRAVVVTGECGDSGTVKDDVVAFGAGLPCGIGEGQILAAYGVGCEGDTSPLGGLLCSTARLGGWATSVLR